MLTPLPVSTPVASFLAASTVDDMRSANGISSVDVASHATGGDGSSGSPWTGWESAINAGWTTYFFRTGHYSHDGETNFLYEGIQLIGDAGVYIHSTGTNYCFRMDASQVASIWIMNVRVENINVLGNAGGTTKNGFFLCGVRNGIFKHLSAKNVVNAAIWTEACVTNTLENFRCTFNEKTGGSGGAGPFATKPKYGIVGTCRGDFAGGVVSNDYSTTWTVINPVIEGVSHYGIWWKNTSAPETSYGHTVINGTCESLAANNIGTLTGCSYSSSSYTVTVSSTADLMPGALINSDVNTHFAANTRVVEVVNGTSITVNRKPLTTGTNNIPFATPAIGLMVDANYNSFVGIDVEQNDGSGDLMVIGSYNTFVACNFAAYQLICGARNSFMNGMSRYVIIDGPSTPYLNSLRDINPTSLTLVDNGNQTLYEAGVSSTSNGIGSSLPAQAATKFGKALINSTDAAAGSQQSSPVTRWIGNGWKTNATAASEQVMFQAGVVPVQGSNHPSGKWVLQTNAINALFGTMSDLLSVDTTSGTATYLNIYDRWGRVRLTAQTPEFTVNNGYASTIVMDLGNSAGKIFDRGGGGLKLGNAQDYATAIGRGYDATTVLCWLYPTANDVLQLGQNNSTTPTDQQLKAHDVTTGTGASLTLAGGKGSVAGGALILATSATNGTAAARMTIKASGVINITGVPTSSSGLSSGDIYSNSGVLTVVP